MWESLKTRATDFTGSGRYRRRGAKLGLLIAVLITLPGLVAATAYVTGASSGSTNAKVTNVATISCGFSTTASTDTGIFTTSATSALSGSVTTSFNAIETGGTGGSGYEYLVDELALGCENIPTSTILTLDVQICGYDMTGTTPPLAVATSTCTAGTIAGVVNADVASLDTAILTQPTAGTNPTASSLYCGSNAAVGSPTAGKEYSTQGAGTGQEVIYDDAAAGLATASVADTAPQEYAYPPGDLSLYSSAVGTLAYNTGSGTCVKPATTAAAADSTNLNAYDDLGSAAADTQTVGLQFVTECQSAGAGTTPGCEADTGSVKDYAWFSIAIVDEGSAGLGSCTFVSASTTTCGAGTALAASTTMWTITFSASDGSVIGS